jgi:hypothetical protein
VVLPAEAVAALDAASKPTLNFPAAFLQNANMFGRGGTTIDGQANPRWPMAPDDKQRY